jgi:hypothetical protein
MCHKGSEVREHGWKSQSAGGEVRVHEWRGQSAWVERSGCMGGEVRVYGWRGQRACVLYVPWIHDMQQNDSNSLSLIMSGLLLYCTELTQNIL